MPHLFAVTLSADEAMMAKGNGFASTKCNHVGGRQELQSSIQQRCEAPHSRERGRNLQMELRKASLLNVGLMLPASGNYPDLKGILLFFFFFEPPVLRS